MARKVRLRKYLSAPREAAAEKHLRTRGRVVEGARLESVYRGDSIVGSNPTVSAIFLPSADLVNARWLPIPLPPSLRF
jgi:hypothetical protein